MTEKRNWLNELILYRMDYLFIDLCIRVCEWQNEGSRGNEIMTYKGKMNIPEIIMIM